MLLFWNAIESFCQATYLWNTTGVADWTSAANWSPSRVTPVADDILLFKNGGIATLINIPTQSIGQLAVSNNTTINLQAGAAGNILTVTGHCKWK